MGCGVHLKQAVCCRRDDFFGLSFEAQKVFSAKNGVKVVVKGAWRQLGVFWSGPRGAQGQENPKITWFWRFGAQRRAVFVEIEVRWLVSACLKAKRASSRAPVVRQGAVWLKSGPENRSVAKAVAPKSRTATRVQKISCHGGPAAAVSGLRKTSGHRLAADPNRGRLFSV